MLKPSTDANSHACKFIGKIDEDIWPYGSVIFAQRPGRPALAHALQMTVGGAALAPRIRLPNALPPAAFRLGLGKQAISEPHSGLAQTCVTWRSEHSVSLSCSKNAVP